MYSSSASAQTRLHRVPSISCVVFYINRDIDLARKSIQDTEAVQAEPKEVVIAMKKESSIRFNRLQDTITELTEATKRIDVALRIRKKGFLQMRSRICRNAAHFFAERLQARGYYGKLEFDHDHGSKTMHILVNPNSEATEEDDARGARDIKTLSGGEKSFCTVSLVLSLWEDMNPPFRILDEFDVFMDSINRRAAIDLILNYAQEQRKFQYLFLTPLNLDHLKEAGQDVQVIHFEKNHED